MGGRCIYMLVLFLLVVSFGLCMLSSMRALWINPIIWSRVTDDFTLSGSFSPSYSRWETPSASLPKYRAIYVWNVSNYDAINDAYLSYASEIDPASETPLPPPPVVNPVFELIGPFIYRVYEFRERVTFRSHSVSPSTVTPTPTDAASPAHGSASYRPFCNLIFVPERSVHSDRVPIVAINVAAAAVASTVAAEAPPAAALALAAAFMNGGVTPYLATTPHALTLSRWRSNALAAAYAAGMQRLTPSIARLAGRSADARGTLGATAMLPFVGPLAPAGPTEEAWSSAGGGSGPAVVTRGGADATATTTAAPATGPCTAYHRYGTDGCVVAFGGRRGTFGVWPTPPRGTDGADDAIHGRVWEGGAIAPGGAAAASATLDVAAGVGRGVPPEPFVFPLLQRSAYAVPSQARVAVGNDGDAPLGLWSGPSRRIGDARVPYGGPRGAPAPPRGAPARGPDRAVGADDLGDAPRLYMGAVCRSVPDTASWVRYTVPVAAFRWDAAWGPSAARVATPRGAHGVANATWAGSLPDMVDGEWAATTASGAAEWWLGGDPAAAGGGGSHGVAGTDGCADGWGVGHFSPPAPAWGAEPLPQDDGGGAVHVSSAAVPAPRGGWWSNMSNLVDTRPLSAVPLTIAPILFRGTSGVCGAVRMVARVRSAGGASRTVEVCGLTAAELIDLSHGDTDATTVHAGDPLAAAARDAAAAADGDVPPMTSAIFDVVSGMAVGLYARWAVAVPITPLPMPPIRAALRARAAAPLARGPSGAARLPLATMEASGAVGNVSARGRLRGAPPATAAIAAAAALATLPRAMAPVLMVVDAATAAQPHCVAATAATSTLDTMKHATRIAVVATVCIFVSALAVAYHQRHRDAVRLRIARTDATAGAEVSAPHMGPHTGPLPRPPFDGGRGPALPLDLGDRGAVNVTDGVHVEHGAFDHPVSHYGPGGGTDAVPTSVADVSMLSDATWGAAYGDNDDDGSSSDNGAYGTYAALGFGDFGRLHSAQYAAAPQRGAVWEAQHAPPAEFPRSDDMRRSAYSHGDAYGPPGGPYVAYGDVGGADGSHEGASPPARSLLYGVVSTSASHAISANTPSIRVAPQGGDVSASGAGGGGTAFLATPPRGGRGGAFAAAFDGTVSPPRTDAGWRGALLSDQSVGISLISDYGDGR